MKKLLFTLIAISVLASCEKTPEQKAGKLIEAWMSTNKPNASYRQHIHYAMLLDFSREDELVFDSLYVKMDNERYYDKYSFKSKQSDSTNDEPEYAKLSETFNSIADKMTDLSRMVAESRIQIYKDSIESVKETLRAKYPGEKGYKVRLDYSLNNQTKELIFYINESLTSITDVEEK